jgi:hypothetical protein
LTLEEGRRTKWYLAPEDAGVRPRASLDTHDDTQQRSASKRQATGFDRALPKFEPALLATSDGAKKATLALRALRKKPVDDERWLDLCIDLLDTNGHRLRRQPAGYRPELSGLLLEAARALQHIDDARAVPRLLALLELPLPHEPARPLVVFLIGCSRDTEAVGPLLEWFLRQSKLMSDSVYREVADALVRLSTPEIVKCIRAMLSKTRNGHQRWALEQALESIARKTGPTHSLTYRIGVTKKR